MQIYLISFFKKRLGGNVAESVKTLTLVNISRFEFIYKEES